MLFCMWLLFSLFFFLTLLQQINSNGTHRESGMLLREREKGGGSERERASESEDARLETEEKLLQVPHLSHPAGLHASATWTSVVSRLLSDLVPLPFPRRVSSSLPQGGISRLEAPRG